ncbi:MAG: hypothetical protein MJ219_03760 [Mycoplasmoidaceae bacterium]|nr:hypothetical protein [Mycoplasmoidaceae bacterium]
MDEPVGQVTLTFTEMSDKVPTVAFDSDIVFNIPVKGQSFTNVHINSGDGFRGITLSEMTAIYGEDLVAKYDVNSSYDADLAEAYFQVGTEGTHVSIIAEDGTITIP